MGWRGTMVGGLLVMAAAGCVQLCDRPIAMMPDCNDCATALPAAGEAPPPGTTVPPGPAPATVKHLEREPRYLSLAEAIALALEQGNVGTQASLNPGLATEDLVSFSGQGLFGSNNIRVLALQPAITGANIEAALGRFDAVWFNTMNWTTTDEPVQGLSSFQNGQSAFFQTGVAKPLATGGTAGLTFNTTYQYLRTPPTAFPILNPSYTTRLQFGFEQPLLRGAGVGVNQILPSFPGSLLFPTLNQRPQTGQGILIARLRFDQQRADFERQVAYQLLNVEAAYWNLYGAYVNLYSTEQALRMATEVWRIAKEQYPERIDEGDFAGTRGQFQQFRANRLQAIGQILDAERTLRNLLGLPGEDGCRLVPVDTPFTDPVLPNWCESLQEAFDRRPELVMAREEVKNRKLQMQALLNLVQPDLRFQSSYTLVGLGNRLDDGSTFLDPTGTPRTNNALQSLFDANFANWTVGLNLTVPLGYRFEHASLRQAKLQLEQALLTLKEQEQKTHIFLARQYSRLVELYETYEARRQQREAYAVQVDARFRKFAAGKIASVDFLQSAVQLWSTALIQEYQAVVAYNQALAAFQFGKGSMLEYDNVKISEGQLPQCAQVRAVVHERQRTEGIVLRQRAAPIAHPPCSPAKGVAGLPDLPRADAVNLPSLLEATKKVPDDLDPDAPAVAQKTDVPAPPRAATLADPQQSQEAATASRTMPAMLPPVPPEADTEVRPADDTRPAMFLRPRGAETP